MDETFTLTEGQLARAFAEWRRRWAENPEGFAEPAGEPMEVGQGDARYLLSLVAELDGR